MRKQLLGLAAISLLLGVASCTEETIETINDGKNQIEFKTALGKQAVTRVAEFTNDSWVAGATLTVKSYYPGVTTAFKDFTLTNAAGGTGAWTVSPNDINQPGAALRYYSVYPDDDITVGTVTKDAYPFDYTVKARTSTTDSQEDLIAAAVTTISENVTLPFKHALSQVNFAVQAMPGVKIEISDLNVNTVRNAGTCTLESGKEPAWVPSTTSTDTYAYPLNNSTGEGTNLLAAGTSTAVVDLQTVDANGKLNGALMLLPQTFSAEADGTFSFKFSLTIDGNGDGKFDNSEKDKKKANGLTATVNLCDFQTTTWLPGKRYKYIIDFSSYLAGGPISFTVNVVDWENDIDITVNETLHVADATALSIEAAIAKHSAANEASTELTTFPINVPTTTTETKIEIGTIEGFDYADEIRIEFKDNTTAGKLECTDTNWSLTLPTNDRVVTLKRNNVNRLNVSTATAEAIETAIAKHSATNALNTTFASFPIIVAGEIAENTKVDIISIIGFDVDDKIVITLPDAASAGRLEINVPGGVGSWTKDVVNETVTLTCVSPITTAQIAANVNVATAGDTPAITQVTLEAAVTTQNTKKGSTNLKVFPITVPIDIASEITITDATIGNFAVGDRIRITCTNAVSAGNIKISSGIDTGWDLVAYDNIVIIDKKQ